MVWNRSRMRLAGSKTELENQGSGSEATKDNQYLLPKVCGSQTFFGIVWSLRCHVTKKLPKHRASATYRYIDGAKWIPLSLLPSQSLFYLQASALSVDGGLKPQTKEASCDHASHALVLTPTGCHGSPVPPHMGSSHFADGEDPKTPSNCSTQLPLCPKCPGSKNMPSGCVGSHGSRSTSEKARCNASSPGCACRSSAPCSLAATCHWESFIRSTLERQPVRTSQHAQRRKCHTFLHHQRM